MYKFFITDNTAQTDFNGDRLFPVPAAVAGVKAPMRSDDRIEITYAMDNDSDISSFGQPSQDNLIRAHSPQLNHVLRTPTPMVAPMGGHVGPQGPDDGVHPSAPPAESEYGSVSAPPSYRSPRDSISQPQSEPPSYSSSGPPSLMRQRPNRPASSSISFRLRVPPPSYDEAMEKREEAKGGFAEGGVSIKNPPPTKLTPSHASCMPPYHSQLWDASCYRAMETVMQQCHLWAGLGNFLIQNTISGS